MNYSHAVFRNSIAWPRPNKNGNDALSSVGNVDGFIMVHAGADLRVEKAGYVLLVPFSNVLQATPIPEEVAPPKVVLSPAERMAHARAGKASK